MSKPQMIEGTANFDSRAVKLRRHVPGSLPGRCFVQSLILLFALAAVCPLFAVEPVLNDLQPRGGQRGKIFTLTLKGVDLTAGADLVTPLTCTITKLAPPRDAEMPGSELAYLIRLPDDAAVGAYPVRIRTPGGLSNVQIFSVSDLPEIAEAEPNDSIAEAQPISVPLAISGTLKGADQDFFSFTATAHQRLVIEVEARRIGSAIDPALEVYDSAGHLIAQNDDAPGLGVNSRLDMTFPKAGKYFVAVHDSKFSDQAQNFYRLKIGSYAYADGIYPLGWQRGKSVAGDALWREFASTGGGPSGFKRSGRAGIRRREPSRPQAYGEPSLSI